MLATLGFTLCGTLGVLLVAVIAVWVLSVFRRDASIADIFWGLGFVMVAWVAIAMNLGANFRGCLITTLTTIWGLRLATFLAWRNWGHGEDRRYAAMRSQHGERFWWVSLFTVFLLQGGILWFVSLPVQVSIAQSSGANGSAASFHWLDALGVALWSIGFIFETVGDWQLALFKANPANAGRVMDHGLWRYTRHPNYFGDFCVWWGLYLLACASGAVWTIASPLLMSYLLLRVSGVTLLESTITDRRPDYAAYKARTNAFFPGPPKEK